MKSCGVKERSVRFHAHEVLATLAGRKTQFRRVLKFSDPRWEIDEHPDNGQPWPYYPCYVTAEPESQFLPCPYGLAGERLWVKEGWAVSAAYDSYAPSVLTRHVGTVQYRAGGGKFSGELVDRTCFDVDGGLGRWRASIHMPRWASRLTLEIVSVRVERLQEISEEDAEAEGCPKCERCLGSQWGRGALNDELSNACGGRPWSTCLGVCEGKTAQEWFRDLWDKTNGKDSWLASPWVWVVGFRRIEEE